MVTTVLSRGKSCNIDSPKVAPTPKLHKVTGICKLGEKKKDTHQKFERKKKSNLYSYLKWMAMSGWWHGIVWRFGELAI